jgi:hypothetical protein
MLSIGREGYEGPNQLNGVASSCHNSPIAERCHLRQWQDGLHGGAGWAMLFLIAQRRTCALSAWKLCNRSISDAAKA